MSTLDEVIIEDILIKRRVPTVTPEETLSKAIKEMVRSKVNTIVIIGDDHELSVSTNHLSYYIANNIWNLDVIIDRLSIEDVLHGGRKIEKFKLDTPVKKIIEKIVREKDNTVVEEDGSYYEVTPEDLIPLYIIWEEEAGENAQNIANKDVVLVPPQQSIKGTYEKYTKNGLDAAIVTNQLHEPIGIVTNTDYVFSYGEIIRITSKIRRDRDMKITIDKIMNKPVVTSFEQDSINTSLRKMVENNIGHLPLVDEDNEVTSMIYKYDVLSWLVRLDEAY